MALAVAWLGEPPGIAAQIPIPRPAAATPARTLYRFRIIVHLRVPSRAAPLRSLRPLAWLRLLSRSGFHAGGMQSHPSRVTGPRSPPLAGFSRRFGAAGAREMAAGTRARAWRIAASRRSHSPVSPTGGIPAPAGHRLGGCKVPFQHRHLLRHRARQARPVVRSCPGKVVHGPGELTGCGLQLQRKPERKVGPAWTGPPPDGRDLAESPRHASQVKGHPLEVTASAPQLNRAFGHRLSSRTVVLLHGPAEPAPQSARRCRRNVCNSQIHLNT